MASEFNCGNCEYYSSKQAGICERIKPVGISPKGCYVYITGSADDKAILSVRRDFLCLEYKPQKE